MFKFVLAAVLATASIPAMAQAPVFHSQTGERFERGPEATGSFNPLPPSSADQVSTDAAADGNANELTKPTQNYGNVSGGYVGRE